MSSNWPKWLAAGLTFWLPGRVRRDRWRKEIIYAVYGFPVRRRAKCVGTALHCAGPVHVTRRTEIADHACFNGMFINGTGRVSIGRYFHSGKGLRVFTRNHNYNDGAAIPYDNTYVVKEVVIGDFVWIGADVILLPGTKIGEGAVIQAGSVVHGEIPPLSIAGGNPAKVFAYRDAEHFNRLKAAGKFH